MESKQVLVLRCPIETIITLSIPVVTSGSLSYVQDATVIHQLRNSLFVRVSLDADAEIIVTEVFPFAGKLNDEGAMPLPDFGYMDGEIVWVSRRVVFEYDKPTIMKDLPRAIRDLQLLDIWKEWDTVGLIM